MNEQCNLLFIITAITNIWVCNCAYLYLLAAHVSFLIKRIAGNDEDRQRIVVLSLHGQRDQSKIVIVGALINCEEKRGETKSEQR